MFWHCKITSFGGGVCSFLLCLTTTAIFVSWHATDFGYTTVYGNLDISAQDGSRSSEEKLISRTHYKVRVGTLCKM